MARTENKGKSKKMQSEDKVKSKGVWGPDDDEITETEDKDQSETPKKRGRKPAKVIIPAETDTDDGTDDDTDQEPFQDDTKPEIIQSGIPAAVRRGVEGYKILDDMEGAPDPDEYIKNAIIDKLGADAENVNDIALVVGVFDEERNDWEKLGTPYKDMSLDDLDPGAEGIAEKIGNQFGPGWYKVQVRSHGKIMSAISFKLSARRFKKQKQTSEAITPAADPVMMSMLAAEKDRAARLEQRQHELMMSIISKPKDEMSIEKLITVAKMLTNGNGNDSGKMVDMAMKLMEKGMEFRDEARKNDDDMSFMQVMGSTLREVAGPLMKKVVSGVGSQLPPNNQPAAEYAPDPAGTAPRLNPPPPTAAASVNKVIDRNMIDERLKAELAAQGALVAFFSGMVHGCGREDDPDVFADQICEIQMYGAIGTLIKSADNNTVIDNLKKVDPILAGYFEDETVKQYACKVFDLVRNPPPDVPDVPPATGTGENK